MRGLSESIDLLHWAGAETSDVWNGYMDAGVRSGERAAAEVLTQQQALLTALHTG